MKKILLLSALILCGSIWGREPEKTQAEIAKERGAAKGLDPRVLYSDIFQVANDLFNLKNEKNPAKFSQEDINTKIKLLNGYIEDAVTYIKTNMKEERVAHTVVKTYSAEIINRFNALRTKNRSFITEELRSIYKVSNITIANLIPELNTLKMSNPDAEAAKNLVLNICKLLQNIGNKIIADYTFGSVAELKGTMETVLQAIFYRHNYQDGVKQDEIQVFNTYFTKLGYVVNFGDNLDFMRKFTAIYALYNSTIDAINAFAQAFAKKGALVFNGEPLRGFLTNKTSDFKNISKAVDKVATETAADKNAKAILQLLLKMYEPILKKIEKEFDYKSAMKKDIDSIKFTGDFSKPQFLEESLRKLRLAAWQLESFLGSEGYDSGQYTFYNQDLYAMMRLMGDLYWDLSVIASKDRAERVSWVDRDIDAMNELIKSAGSLINKISQSESARSLLKALLSKFKDFVNKFGDYTRKSLKITTLDEVKEKAKRFKEFLTGGKKSDVAKAREAFEAPRGNEPIMTYEFEGQGTEIPYGKQEE